jgi:hypothetical protein
MYWRETEGEAEEVQRGGAEVGSGVRGREERCGGKQGEARRGRKNFEGKRKGKRRKEIG